MSSTLATLAKDAISENARFQVTDQENEIHCKVMERDDFLDFYGIDEDTSRKSLLWFISECAFLNDMEVGSTRWDAFDGWIIHRIPDEIK